jgi:hypothetical protein
MAGKIIADQIEHSTAGSIATNYVVEGSAKAWVNYTSNTTTSIRDSLNTSSLSDVSTGKTIVTFSNAMANANYSCPTACSNGDAGSTACSLDPHTFVTGSTKFNSFANASLADRNFNMVSFLGDLA